ncbi:endolytic transglycosylase MltG [Thalassobacillus sp. CUG 92003]|uniref:endolytic transglycosylase MltG n=1 Tax=Thalassobacillus sp. CUG 92003 TaxID=2736641 RepID=UPI0015E685F1|nr:endolytic transglycosylase MltG [Thalassobacillus sp. CUG 92003]
MSDSKFDSEYKERLHKRTEEAGKVRKIVALVLTSLIILLIVGGVSGYFYVKSALEPVDPSDESETTVEIPLGSSTSEIASILKENGIINNELIFRFYTKFKNVTGFQAGEYDFTKAMTIDEILQSLKTGKVMLDPLLRVTIPEGSTVEQIAARYAEHFNFTKEEFLKKIDDEAYVNKLIEEHPALLDEVILDPEIKHPLEGYLFATTYPFFEENPPIDQIVQKMLAQTKEVVLPYMDSLEGNRLSSVHEVITMASLLEKEAPKAESRKRIAGVFYNRLAQDMPLQTDPTVLYAIGEHKDRVLYEDTEVESPFNTYHINGLPIGPISNFNENALDAAVQPIDSENLYFLADQEGNIYYSKTLEEHNKKKAEHISQNSEDKQPEEAKPNDE